MNKNNPHVIHFPAQDPENDAIDQVPDTQENLPEDLQDTYTVNETQMPHTLALRILKTVGIGVAIIVLSFALMIMERRAQYLICTAIGIGFILWGLNFRRMFFSGQIEERAMRCISSIESKVGKRLRVSFVDAEGSYHEFLMDSRTDPFVVNATYLLYSKRGHPKELLCWQMV